MVTISITAEAYAAMRATLPKGVRSKPRLDEGSGFKITLDRHTLDRLKALRGPGESYSDVILRLATDTPTTA
jgi:predicted CopG family antitoxin